ncbi:MAG: hypothetical protein R3C14_13985 [Caldilineaceae bacterium]
MSVLQPDGPTTDTYCSYLVRFWRSNEHGCWRASAQCVQTGNTVLFGDVASLLAFLQTEIPISPAPAAESATLPADRLQQT